MTYPMISVGQLRRYLKRGEAVMLIDIRSGEEYLSWHPDGAIHLPYEEFSLWSEDLPQDKLLVLYCNRGSKSLLAARELCRRKYKAVSLAGGIACVRCLLTDDGDSL